MNFFLSDLCALEERTYIIPGGFQSSQNVCEKASDKRKKMDKRNTIYEHEGVRWGCGGEQKGRKKNPASSLPLFLIPGTCLLVCKETASGLSFLSNSTRADKVLKT